jgi:xylan 1,4-beta-xylosidase
MPPMNGKKVNTCFLTRYLGMKRKFTFILITLFYITIAYGQTYENPIITGMNSDPSVCRVGSDFYLTTSSCGYFPGIPIYKSSDLINWQLIGHCITRSEQMDFLDISINAGLWATTIRYNKGIFYVICTHMKDNRNFIVTASNPAGEWSDPVYLDTKGFTYDPSLYFDDDGKIYFNYASGEGKNVIKLSEIDIKSGKILTQPKDIWYGGGGFGAEGAHIYKINNFFYIISAEGGNSNQAVVLGRAKNIYGPYDLCPVNPIVSNKENRQYLFQSTGHGDLIQFTDKSWWLIIHGLRNYGGFDALSTVFGRETILLPVTWKNNWPIVYGNKPVTRRISYKGMAVKTANISFNDDFTSSKMKLGWYFQRHPANELCKIDTNKNQLVIQGNENDIDSESEKAFIGKKQDLEWGKLQVKWTFDAQLSSEEAGITFFMNENHHFDCFITKGISSYNLVLRRKFEDITYVQTVLPLENPTVTIQVQANPWAYEFFLVTENGDKVSIGKMQNNAVTLHVAGGFIGVMIGMYSTGNGQKCKNPAYFDYFKYSEMPNLVPDFKE